MAGKGLNRRNDDHEMSMEEILASIRKYVTDEDPLVVPKLGVPAQEVSKKDASKHESPRDMQRDIQRDEQRDAYSSKDGIQTYEDYLRMEEAAAGGYAASAQNTPHDVKQNAYATSFSTSLDHQGSKETLGHMDAAALYTHHGVAYQNPVTDVTPLSSTSFEAQIDTPYDPHTDSHVMHYGVTPDTFSKPLYGDVHMDASHAHTAYTGAHSGALQGDNFEEKHNTDYDAEKKSFASTNTISTASKSFEKLVSKAKTLQEQVDQPTPTMTQNHTLEDLAVQCMAPYIKIWLDAYLPELVERLVQKEIEKLTREVLHR